MEIILSLYLAGFILCGLLWRIYITWRRTGVNAVRLPAMRGAEGMTALLFVAATSGELIIIFLYLTGWITLETLIPIGQFMHPAIFALGGALLIVTLAIILLSQHQMGKSWRIGIDEKSHTELVKTGIFRYSRNPIFLSMRISFLALFLVMPSVATLVVMLAGDLALRQQVRIEERYLAKKFGEAYMSYCRDTGRWLSLPSKRA